MAAPVLQFQPFTSSPHVSFFQKLAELKLNTFQLSDARQDISGFFELSPHADVPARFIVDDTAFGYDPTQSPDRAKREWRLPGVLVNTNTLDAFKTIDKAALLDDARASVASSIADDAEKMQCFVLVTFADLKTHTFWYRFAFPALVPPSPYRVTAWQPLTTFEAPLAQASIMQQLIDLRPCTEADGITHSNFPMQFVLDKETGTVVSLASAPAAPDNLLFGIVDPSALPQHPGWPLRNYLAWIRRHYPSLTSATILLFRDPLHHLTTAPASLVAKASFIATVTWASEDAETNKVVGWELNVQGKQGPRCMQLGSLMDPLQLAKTSVDLNLKLMRWRQLPSLDLDKLASTKCLLLGAGTLGCHVGRNLLSWGFRHLAFVDNGLVSHSNPVRQPLFEFNDVGKPKAATAAKALARIFPLVHAEGHTLSIPMAGHAMSSPSALADNEQAFEALRTLIDEHDVVFLGTDSRESRWLPTVMAAASQKLVINAALGFDSYLVMRHGVPDAVDLGCYFCNDIVSPGDSLADRTLDQMCTVTRPGGAAMAGATAVELLVCLLHQPLGAAAPVATEASAGALGVVPHQIRGFLHSFSQVLVQGPSFPKCTACSRPVREAYSRDGFGLFASVCASKTYLQDLTGLSALMASADAMTFADDDVSDDESLL